MNETAGKHLLRTASEFRQGMGGDRVTLQWRGGHSGTYDERRGEYTDSGGEVIATLPNVPCIVYQIRGTYEQREWGDAEVGDLVIAVDPSTDLSNVERLEVIYQNGYWEVVPNSRIPAMRLAGVIAGRPVGRVLHCRYRGVVVS